MSCRTNGVDGGGTGCCDVTMGILLKPGGYRWARFDLSPEVADSIAYAEQVPRLSHW
jgi:hypothetical protein